MSVNVEVHRFATHIVFETSIRHMRNALHRLNPKLYLQYAGRDASAAPACGHMSVHIEEQKKLVNDAFEI